MALKIALNEKDYREAKGLSHSELKAYVNCPHHWEQEFVSKTFKRERTDSMLFGSAVDRFVEDPVLFDLSFALSKGRRTSETDDAGRILLTETMFDRVIATGEAVRQNEWFRLLTDGSMRQPSVFATDQKTKVPLKGRPDFVKKEGTRIVITDLKTTADASPYSFERSFLEYGYATQLAFYTSLLSRHFKGDLEIESHIIAVDKGSIVHYEIGGSLIVQGLQKIEEWIGLFAAKEARKFRETETHDCPLGLSCPVQSSLTQTFTINGLDLS